MILARHAESLFWAGRFLERAEMTSRWLDVASRSSMHLVAESANIEWGQLIDALGLRTTYGDRPQDQSSVSYFLLTDPNSTGSVRTSTESMRDNLRVARDRVPVELWEAVNQLHNQLTRFEMPRALDQAPTAIFRTVREGCQTISGVLAEAMMRDEGHAFIVIGRMIERSMLTSQLVATAVRHPGGDFDADRVLRSASALQAFRRLHGHNDAQATVLRFLLTTPDLPRSVLSCLRQIETRLASLSRGNNTMATPQQLAGRIRSHLEYGDLDHELEDGGLSLVAEIQQGLTDLSNSIGSQVFRPLGDPILHSQFVRPGREV